MKGTYFGAKPFAPCPSCGTERMLLDYDDDAYVVPVEWYEADTCDGEIYIEAWSAFTFLQEWDRVRDAACPKCGGPIEWVEKRMTDFRTSSSPCYAVGRCSKGSESKQWREIEGCPQCRGSSSHIPIHED